MTTRITGTGSYLPNNIVTNNDLERIVNTSDDWIFSRTGIKERRIATTTNNTKMAIRAAKAAIINAGIKPSEIDIIVLATVSPDKHFPSGACEVQKGIRAVNAAAFDVGAACAGFVFALNTVHAYIKAGIYKTGLVIGVDSFSKLVDWSDRNTCVLFGDGAGAAVVQESDVGIIQSMIASDGSKGDVLTCENRSKSNFLRKKRAPSRYVKMNGQEVFSFAVKVVPKSIREVLKEADVNIDDIKYFVLHQANERIIQSAAKRLKVDIEKFPSNLGKYGNTSSASIPILLDELNREGKLEKGDKIVMSGFGAGLSWGAILLEW